MANFVYRVIGFFLFLGAINVAFTQDTNKTLRVVSILDYPYLYEGADSSLYGFIPDLLDLLGLNYEIKLTNRYGSMLDNGSWTGMVKALTEDTADVAALLTVTDMRSRYVDFTYPIQTAGPTIVMKKPVVIKPSLEERLTMLLKPLESSVWLMSFLALLVTGTVLYIIGHCNPYEWRRMYKDREATVREAESFSFLNSFWFVVSTLMWQGYVRAPRSAGARILVVAWWAFVVIFLLTYTASLTNFLAGGRETAAVKGYAKIKSFKDLVDNDDVRVGILPQGATEASFRDSKSPIFQQLYDKIVKDRTNETTFYSMHELVRYTREQSVSHYAVILEASMANFVSHQEPCNLYMVKDDYNLRTTTFAVQRGSTLGEQLSLAILKLHEAGSLYSLQNKWFKQNCTANVIRTEDSQPLQLPNVYAVDIGTFSAALMILVVGIFLGGFVTLIEVCIYKWAESHTDDEEETEGVPL